MKVSADAVGMMLDIMGYPAKPPKFNPQVGKLYFKLTNKQEMDDDERTRAKTEWPYFGLRVVATKEP